MQQETLYEAFKDFGSVQNVKVIREKGGKLGKWSVIFGVYDHRQLLVCHKRSHCVQTWIHISAMASRCNPVLFIAPA